MLITFFVQFDEQLHKKLATVSIAKTEIIVARILI